jgi:uncharacterized protein
MANHEHPFANPGPAGQMVLAFYLACLWPIATNQAPHELAPVLVALGLAGGIVQLTAGIIELRNGEIVGGNIMCAFSAFMFLGMGENLLKALKLLPSSTAAVDGWIFLVMGLLMVGFTPCFFTANLGASVFMIFTDIFFCSAGLSWILGSSLLWTIAGWSLPFVVLSILWNVFGRVLNTHFGRQVIKMGPPLIKKEVK